MYKLKIVKNACAVYDSQKKEIVLFYESEVEVLITEFRNALAIIVPKYMMPSKFEWFNELPQNTNGKIDRNFLKNYINK